MESWNIHFRIIASIRAPIIEGNYSVKDKIVSVSYPKQIDLGAGAGLIDLPKSLSTCFDIIWIETDKRVVEKLQSLTSQRHHLLFDILEYINEILTAFKLVRIGHSEGSGVRRIGKSDILMYFCLLENKPILMNLGLQIQQQDYPHLLPNSTHPQDTHGTTEIAIEHIGKKNYPIIRKFIRCFELIELGFYSEALLVSFSILDDNVQNVLYDLLKNKGLVDSKKQEEFLRAIKEQRLYIYLGSMLKILSGQSIEDLWSESPKAIEWLNKLRNKIAHKNIDATHSEAKVSLYLCIKILHILSKKGLIVFDCPKEIYRTAKINAAWSEKPPTWVPKGIEAENYEFN